MSFRFGTIVLSVSSLMLAGCSGDGTTTVSSPATVPTVAQTDSSTDAASPTESPLSAPSVDLKAFIDALNTNSDPETMREARSMAAKGSIADVYVDHLANVSESALDGGSPLTDPASVDEVSPGSFKSCDDPADSKTCATFADFQTDNSGKIANLTVNGKTLGDRLTTGDGKPVVDKEAKFTFLTAYRSVVSNALFVTLKVETGGKAISPNIYSATYRSPDGKQRDATDAYGPIDIDEESNSIVTMIFQGVKVGGKVTLDGCVGADCGSQFEAVIKIG